MIRNYKDFAAWVLNLPEGNRIILDELPEAGERKIRYYCGQINKRNNDIPVLMLLTPTEDSGYRWSLRRYDGWELAVYRCLGETGIQDKVFDAFRDTYHTGREVIEVAINTARTLAVRYNRECPPDRKVRVSEVDGKAVITPQIRKHGQRATWVEQIEAGGFRDGIPVPEDLVQYARVFVSAWNKKGMPKLSVNHRDGVAFIVERGRGRVMDFYLDAERAGVAVVAANKALHSTKSVQVVHYPDHTVGYRRDADLLLRRWRWEKHGVINGDEIAPN